MITRILLISLLCCRVFAGPGETNKLPDAVESIANVPRGISLERLKAMVPLAFRYDFSAMIDKHRYLGVEATVRELHSLTFVFLFRDEKLVAVLTPPSPEWETTNYKGTKWTRPKPISSEELLQKTLEQPNLTKEGVLEIARDRAAIPKPKASRPNIPSAVLAPLKAKMSAQREQSQKEAAVLAKRFDPFKIALGMTLEEVKAQFGAPYHVVRDDNATIHIYGGSVKEVGDVRSVWVSVVFENGKVKRIFSNRFFDKRPIQNKSE